MKKRKEEKQRKRYEKAAADLEALTRIMTEQNEKKLALYRTGKAW